MTKTLRTCPQGHRYYKSSDCPTCPHCEAGRKPVDGFLARLGAPARRALSANGIHSLGQLATFRAADILALHGVGKSSLPVLREELAKAGLAFRED